MWTSEQPVDDRLHAVGRMDILRRDPAVIASALALLLAIAYLLAPNMGVDLAAQLARADFARHHPLAPVDLRWFGGTFPFGYSLWVPSVMAVMGSKIVGALSVVASTYLVTRLFHRIGARRPLAGGVATAMCQLANLVEGRIAFGAGLACGLGALLAISRRRSLAAFLSFLAGAANPVVALLLWVCAAVAVTHRRVIDAVTLAVASAIPVAIIAELFADGGNEPFGRSDALHALGASIVVALVIPLRFKAIRLGAIIGIVMVLAAYFIHTPVGSNATRLSLLFAIPLVVALVELKPVITLATIVIAIAVQVPFTFGTLQAAGSPSTKASYYQPLLSEIETRGQVSGRVEVPEMIGHWDSYFVARSVPLARGWLRQVDTKLNGQVLYAHAPTAATYRNFLDDNAVEYVAVPDARLSSFGRREVAALATMPYLNKTWTSAHWTLYSVDNAVPIVDSPGRLISYSADHIAIAAQAGTTVQLNVRWSRWLSLSGDTGCIERSGNHAALHSTSGGTYVLGSRLVGASGHC
jgi:hypothetical protein